MEDRILVGLIILFESTSMLIESYSLTTWGLLMQNFTYAVCIPIFLAIHLSTSPTVASLQVTDYLVDIPDLIGVLPAMVMGFVLPAVFMSLPAPSVVSFHRKQILMAIWQVFPLWVSILQQGVSFMVKYMQQKEFKREIQQKKSIRAMRIMYLTLLISAAVNQLSTLQFVAISHLFPGLFAPEFRTAWDFGNVFPPKVITAATRMDSVGSGTHMLLQYDEMLGNLSMCLWALVLFTQARTLAPQPLHKIRFSLLCIATPALTGPLGSVVCLVWARDEVIFARATNDKKTK